MILKNKRSIQVGAEEQAIRQAIKQFQISDPEKQKRLVAQSVA
jgi:hypothetical protein